MRYTKFIAGIALSASTTFASAAMINTTTALTFTGFGDLSGADFSHQFGAADSNKTFLDIYTFTITAADIGASFSSPAIIRGRVSDLSFSAFDLYTSSGTRLAIGTIGSGLSPGSDAGALAASLGAGSYKLEIAGTVLGIRGGNYNGSLSVSPVPEPATWGMTLSGLAAVGALVRRRKSSTAMLA